MLSDPVALARMRSNALTAAREEFHWEKEKQTIVQAIKLGNLISTITTIIINIFKVQNMEKIKVETVFQNGGLEQQQNGPICH